MSDNAPVNLVKQKDTTEEALTHIVKEFSKFVLFFYYKKKSKI